MGKFDKKQQSVDSRVVQAINDASLSRRSLIKLLSAGAVMSTGILGFPSLSLAAEKPTQGENCVRPFPMPRQRIR